MAITKTNGTTTSVPGGNTTYTIVARNAGPDPVTGATVSDTFPASTTCTRTCVGSGGGTCSSMGGGSINAAVNLPSGGSTTFTASCAIAASATGSLANTATVSSSVTDPAPGNNSATDTDTDTLVPSANMGATLTDAPDPTPANNAASGNVVVGNSGADGAPTLIPVADRSVLALLALMMGLLGFAAVRRRM